MRMIASKRRLFTARLFTARLFTARLFTARGLSLLMLALLVILQMGCDTSFDPFEESDRYFSMLGYLDAGADTQFVRISPLRDSVALSPQGFEAVVALTTPAMNGVIPFKDSLFEFSDSRFAANFWSDEKITHGSSYVLTVERSDGAKSSVAVSLPEDFPVPELGLPLPGIGQDPRDMIQSIKIQGIKRVADVRLQYVIVFPNEPEEAGFIHSVSYLQRVNASPTGFLVGFRAYDDLREAFNGRCPIVLEARAFIASAGPDWPDLADVDLETLARPDVVSNVTNGVGYIGTISSKTLPWDELAGFMNWLQWICSNES